MTGGVDDVTVVVDALVVDGLVEDTLDGGIVGLDEVVLDELNDERGLPCRGDATGTEGGGRAVSGGGLVCEVVGTHRLSGSQGQQSCAC